MWPGPRERSRLFVVRPSKFLAARMMARGQPHDAHALDRAHSLGKAKHFSAPGRRAGRPVAGANGPVPKQMRRINPVGSVTVAVGPDQDEAVVARAFHERGRSMPRFRPSPTSRLRSGLRWSSVERVSTGALRCEIMRPCSPGRVFAFVDARTHVFVRSVIPVLVRRR